MAKVRLGDIATVVTKGTTPTTIGFQFEDSGINFVKIESISEDGTFLKEKFSHISDECNVQMRRSQLQENDILFSIAGAIGRSVIVTKEILPANTNQALAIIRVPKGKIDYNYLLYALSSSAINQQATQHQQGVAQLNISLKNVSDFLLPIYTEAMQKRIVQNLKKIDKLIFLRKQQLEKLDELVKARFVEMFGDPIGNTKNLPVTKFVDVVKMQRGFDLPVQERKSDGMIPVYGSNGVLGYHDISKVKGGGVITGRSGTIGKVFYEKGEFWPLNTTLFSLNSHGNDVVYLKYLLELFDLSRFTEGTGVPTLNRNKFHDELIIDVPLDEQERFAAFVERVDQQKQTVQQSLEKLELMKKALMQEYFG